jgi:hypothetical protein
MGSMKKLIFFSLLSIIFLAPVSRAETMFHVLGNQALYASDGNVIFLNELCILGDKIAPRTYSFLCYPKEDIRLRAYGTIFMESRRFSMFIPRFYRGFMVEDAVNGRMTGQRTWEGFYDHMLNTTDVEQFELGGEVRLPY